MSYGGPPRGVSGPSFDRFIESQSYSDASTLEKFQHQFYVAKEAVTRKLNKTRSDKDVTASDQELDTKLELFRSIQSSSLDLHKTVVVYQQRVCQLAQSLNALGRFLKETGKSEKAFQGKVMFTVGKVMSFSAYYVLALKEPVDRLQQEVETYRMRAIHDCMRTVKKTEKNRQEYRGMLIWMKEVSEELNPDAYKQLEKFRKVQHQVRASKQKFDKDKLDCMQKVDLLAASRCNMFSLALQQYQENMNRFWNKSDKACESALQAIEERNFRKKREKLLGEDVNEVESSVSLDFEGSLSETALSRDEGENLINVNDIPDAQIQDDLLGSLEDTTKEASEEMDELFRKFSESRLKTDVRRDVSSLDSQFDAIFGLNDPPKPDNGDESAAKPTEEKNEEFQSIFEDSDLMNTEDPMGFLPSHLLDKGTGDDEWLTGAHIDPVPVAPSTPSGDHANAAQPAPVAKDASKTLSWFNTFAELDPLANESKIFAGEHA